MINCIIVDDDQVAVKLLRHYISNTEGISVTIDFSNPITATNYIRKNAETIDLIFLDVEMPEMSGLELLESFEELPPVVLVTNNDKYAVKAFEHKVVHYLVKPIEYSKFLKAMERIFKQVEKKADNSPEYIFIKENGLLSKVHQNDIHYCEALGDYVKVHLKSKTYVVNSTMKNIEDKLKRNKQFLRVHRSYIINLSFLENIESESAIVGGKIIPIGNKYKSELQSKLNII
jgi:DNA-binding LytR/AlgR family response regulator